MNKNIAVLTTLIILFLSAYFLYWQGEVDLERASEKFTVLAFDNADLDCNEKSFEFFIENNLPIENVYNISVLVDNNLLENYPEFTVPAKSTKNVKIDFQKLKELCQGQSKLKYQIKLENQEIKENIYKYIQSK
jgi:hypothetical protein